VQKLNKTTGDIMKTVKMFAVILSLVLFPFQPELSAHCDGEDGPVVIAAKKALDEENVNYVLVWVQKEDEKDIIEAYDKTIAVRKLDPSAKELSDKYFFDTVVRLHRMGEGASFTGVKPAGYNNDPSVKAADNTLEGSKLTELYKLLTEEIHNGLHAAYERVESLKDYDRNNVEAGREYVAAYVHYLHYVEGIYKAAKIEGGHGNEEHKH
jgi:hypothetical protein